ncbi:hypothetical protein [Arthrobacter sp. NPDC093139]|uniref:hypothetical protein n=1 Tax=Arthrobacter sp. NPDC093139 TaxID=3363945 RepID=UPI00381A64FF
MPALQPNILGRALLAGAVVLALSGAGAAVVRAAGETAGSEDAALVSSQPAPPAPGGQGKAEEARGQGKGRELHSESVVKKGDGTLETRITQFGTVESVSETSITVKSEDGFTLAYAIGADTRIRKQAAAAPDGTAPKDDAGKRVKPSAATAADLKQGDTVRIRGVKNGASITARTIIEGAGGKGQGLGQGKGRGMGLGQGKGLGHGQAKAGDRGQAKAGDRGQADDVP